MRCMRGFTLTLFILISLFSSCEEKVIDPFSSNIYTGVFFRTIDGVQQDTSSVRLALKENTFEGSSSKMNYPAIGYGSYIIKNNSVLFTNESPWLAYFEWTYILDDTFSLNKEGSQLILTKKIGTTIVDTYILREGDGE